MSNYADGPATWNSYLKQLPLRDWGLVNCPGVPYWADQYGDPDAERLGGNLVNLNARGTDDPESAYAGLTTQYTIGTDTQKAYQFLFNAPPPPPIVTGNPPAAQLALQSASQYQMPWTVYQGMYSDSQNMVATFAGTLDPATPVAATALFWPTIAQFGIPFNLLVLEKVDAARVPALRALMGSAWTDQNMAALQASGLLYEIDMSILESLEPYTAYDGSLRFTPGTVTVLSQNSTTKALTPIAIAVSTTDGLPPRIYTGTSNAWLYALQAAKASITVWGIWLGHVYHWHIVTAAMQMTMYNTLPAGHTLYNLLQPQSQSLIDFNFTLLGALWGQISPPTPVPGPVGLLTLLDRFADGRTFFDDDPPTELARRGIVASDFTVTTAWDAWPVAGYLLDIWQMTQTYVSTVVNVLYTDTTVGQDTALQNWMAASLDPNVGNIRGLPAQIASTDLLTDVLTSLLYRVNAHGPGSLNPAVNPGLSFVSNFPPCLQSATIPDPSATITAQQLLAYLPHTGTIGGMTKFYYTFAYSNPYQPLIVGGDPTADPYFPNQPACETALVTFRQSVQAFVAAYIKNWNIALAQMRGGQPGQIPKWANPTQQVSLWAASIEI